MKTYSGKKFRKAQAAVALAVFIFPPLAFSQGLKLDLLDRPDCRLFCDSTKRGLTLGQDSAAWLPTFDYARNAYEIDDENRLLTSQSYYLKNTELNENGQYRIFELSDAARQRSESRQRSEWSAAKINSLGKGAGGKAGKGLLNVDIPIKFPKALTSLVGEGGPGLAVTGNYRVVFKLDRNWTTDVARLGTTGQGTPSFQTLQEYNMYINGNVGSKLFVNMKTDKRANVYNQRLDLADRIQIRYKGEDEDLVQSIEAGNTSLALGGTQYAGFSQSVQGLFGLQARGKLGAFNWTGIASQQKGTSQSKTFRAGAEATTFYLRDKDFLRYVYYDLGRKAIAKPDNSGEMPPFVDEFQPGDRLDTIPPLFFKSVRVEGNTQSQYPKGTCYLDPSDTTNTTEIPESGFFTRIPPEEYQLNRDSFYVRFNYPLAADEVLGVAMLIRRANGQVDIIGYADTTTNPADPADTLRYVLKLLKRRSPTVNNVSYYYEWKNVYDLRGKTVDPDGLSVNIYKGATGTEADRNSSNLDYRQDTGVKYLRIVGLDRYINQTGADGFDGEVDLNRTVVDLERGFLVFPVRYPFNTDTSFTGVPGDTLEKKIPAAYGNNTTAAAESSAYYLAIQTKSRRTEFSLGQVDIMEGSEDVRLNGQRLKRGEDYDINYDIGTINFRNTQVTDPNADVQITYEYVPFLTAQKRNLFGLRGEYEPSEQFKIGSTLLYRNASSIDRKPRIGEEPSQALLADVNFGYNGQSNFITRLVDKLPGVAAAAPSAFQLEGEVARSLPNPNTTGRAFIDDFEGSRDFLTLGLRRGVWTKSSMPAGKIQANRGKLIWFTPDVNIKLRQGTDSVATQPFGVKEVFPNRDVLTDEKMDVLEMRFYPKPDSLGSGGDTASWGGIMRWLSQGLQDHQETQLLEFWVGLEEGRPKPRLHFEFGKISEDIDDDGTIDTEDPDRIGVIDTTKDVGLDSLKDNQEPGYPGVLDSSKDNWGRDVDHINGTEGNFSDPERLARPDKEDLNGDGVVGGGAYFAFTVDLNDTLFLVPNSTRPNNGTRTPPITWRQIRVPLKDSTLPGSVYREERGRPSWANIEFVRIWVEGPDTARIYFATLEMVGNRWKVLGTFDDFSKPTTGNQKVQVSVINSQEHPAYRADPPPGVGEVVNQVTRLREREQSLVMTYENLRPGFPVGERVTGLTALGPVPEDENESVDLDNPHRRGDQALVQRVLLGGAEDYSGYGTLKMLVHGDRRIGMADNFSDSLLFFMRFGSGAQNDPNNFYEYRVLLKPGWEANNIQIDFNRLTVLKQKRLARGGAATDTISEGPYFVKGNPSSAAVRWYVLGVQNLDNNWPASGEVWVNELMLTDVRRDAGTAGRIRLSSQLSDFGSLAFEAGRVGSTFRNLSGDAGGTLSYNRGAATNENLSLVGNFQAHKLLPRFLGITGLPISLNWSRARSTPRLRTGTDIFLTPEFAEAERTENLARGISITPSLRRETKNWLWNATFNRMNGSFAYRYNRSSNPFTRLSETRFYSASLSYDLSPKKGIGFKPFGWLPSFWLLKKVENSPFSPLPVSLRFSGDVSRNQTLTIQNDLRGSRTGSYVRDFRGAIGSSFRLFPNLTADYNLQTRRDISNPNNLVFSMSPRRFKLGLEVDRSQDFKTSYNPGLFSFAETRLSFSSRYHEAGGLATSTDGTRTIEASNGYGGSVNFNLSRFLGGKRKSLGAGGDETIRKLEEEKRREEERKRKEEEKKFGRSPALDSARAADSLAKKEALRLKAEAAAYDTIPVERRFRKSLELFFPLPVPGLGFVFPKPAPDPARSEPPNKRVFPDSLTLAQPVRPDSVRFPDSLPAGRADSLPKATAPPDSAKRPPPATVPAGTPQAKRPGPGIGRIFLLSDGVDLLRGLAGRVDPVQFTYNRTNSIGREGLRNRPGLAFQFGLVTDPGEPSRGRPRDRQGNSDVYTVGSGFDLGSGIRANTRYSKNITRNIISSGTSRQVTESFPDVSLTISGLERRVGILKKILPAGSLASNYQKQTTRNFDVGSGQANTITTAKNYSPLVSVTSTFFRGLTANFSYRKSIQTSKNRGLGEAVFVASETRENGYAFSTRYSFIAPRGIRFPFLKGIRLSSSLNTNLSLQYTRRTTTGSGVVTYDVSNLGISPGLTYSFSTQVDGGLTVQWTDQKNRLTKQTSKVRSAVFSVDLKF
ncbi:MAG: cell surface protein SprA [candidate division Zixibacteria bacterium]|nr:cell surface protein SprA [candidate division Zixibacteria bacterium]